MRAVNDEALALIQRWEGLRLEAYQDEGGTWTIGYGHTRTARRGMTITEAEALDLLRADLRTAEADVERLVTVPLTDGQFGALVAFDFNIGADKLSSSTLLRKLNAGDYAAVPVELARWNKVRDKRTGELRVSDGLVNRRAAEAGLWARGSFVVSNTVEPADPPPPPTATAPSLAVGAVAAAAATAAPALEAVSRMPQWVGIALIGAVAAVTVAFVLSRRREGAA